MPYWDDLDMRPTTTGGGIFTEITGSPGSRTLKIEWRARRWIASPSAAPFDTNFAIYFHEGSANFEYVYALTGTGPNASGASATVGVQAASAGAVYTQYSAFSGSLAPGQMINADIAAATCSSGGGPCIATSAPVSVSGRVVTPDGRGISGTRVTIAGENGTRMLSVTNGFGYFRFDGVPAGKSYVVSAAGRGYRFESQIVNITDSIADLTFVGLR
jgi:hypothetical protein